MKRGVALLAAAGWLAHSIGLPVLGPLAGFLLANLSPGLALVRWTGFGGRPLAWRVLAGGALSPPLLAAAALLAGLAGAAPERVGEVVVGLSVLAHLVPRPSREPREESPGIERVLVAAGAALAGLVALALLHPRLPRWSDSWFHAAVFHEVQRAGIHAGFPHFADMPLPYPWFFHLYLAVASPFVSDDPFVLLATVNQLAALLLPAAFYALARALGLPARTSAWAAVAGLLGPNPLGPAILVVRAFTGETGGLEVLARALADADAVQGAMALRFPGFQTTWLARLWTPTAFNFALVLAVLVLVLLVQHLREPRGRTLALFGGALALLLHWHTLTALHLSMGIAAGVAAAALPRLRAEGVRALRPGLAVAAVMLAAYLASRPYLDAVTLGGSASVVKLRLVTDNLAGLVVSMGPLALAAAWSLRALGARERAWAAGALLGLGAPMLLFDLPGMADEKLYWPLFLPVAALAAPALEALASGRAVARTALGALLALSVLGNALTAHAFWHDARPLRAMFDVEHPERAPFYTRDEAAALEWIRGRTPRDAVFLQPLRPAGTEPVLVHGERRMWLGFAEVFYRATFFDAPGRPPIPRPVWDELRRRDALQRRVFAGAPLPAGDLADLRARPWPVYVWWDSALAGGRLTPTLADTSIARVAFASPTVRVLELRR